MAHVDLIPVTKLGRRMPIQCGLGDFNGFAHASQWNGGHNPRDYVRGCRSTNGVLIGPGLTTFDLIRDL